MISRRLNLVLLGSVVSLTGAWACSSGGGATSSGHGGATSSSHSSTTVVTTGTGGSGGGAGANLGLACAQDSDCGAPLHCILPTDNDPVFGGGPANGYCSMSCTSDSDCPGASSICLSSAAGAGDCVPSCTPGPGMKQYGMPLDPSKCQGREDVACEPVNQDQTIFGCVPDCGESSQCPTGEACDPRAAVCVPAASVDTGLPIGAACDPNSATAQCAGVCVNFGSQTDGGPATASCSSPCELGGSVTGNPNCGGVTKGLCAYTLPTNGPGDFGFCAPACKTQDDCQNPAFWCFPIGGLTGTGVGMVPNGYCFGSASCPNGQSDCTAAMLTDTTCTQTPSGPYCLSNTFPLSTGDGGTTDGGGEADAGEADAGDGG